MKLKGHNWPRVLTKFQKSRKMATQNFASRYDDFLSLLPTRGFRLYNSKENKKPVIGAKDCDDFHSFHDDRRCLREVWYLFIVKLWLFSMEVPQRTSPYIIGMFEADFVARKARTI